MLLLLVVALFYSEGSLSLSLSELPFFGKTKNLLEVSVLRESVSFDPNSKLAHLCLSRNL